LPLRRAKVGAISVITRRDLKGDFIVDANTKRDEEKLAPIQHPKSGLFGELLRKVSQRIVNECIISNEHHFQVLHLFLCRLSQLIHVSFSVLAVRYKQSSNQAIKQSSNQAIKKSRNQAIKQSSNQEYERLCEIRENERRE